MFMESALILLYSNSDQYIDQSSFGFRLVHIISQV